MNFDLEKMFHTDLAEHQRVTQHMGPVYGAFEKLTSLCVEALKQGKKILFFGNGGSASDAQHLAAELVVRLRQNRPAIPALALTTDTSALTAIGNDFGFEHIFARQVEGLGCPGDVAMGFSTSGRSPNILNAFKQARQQGLVTACFTGDHGNPNLGDVDIVLNVPSTVTERIQEMHIWLGHVLCAAIEHMLYGSQKA